AGGLRYVGRVGVTGEHRRRMSALVQLRRPLAPFSGAVPSEVARHAVWVAPELVGSVEFTGFSGGGRLRLPRWLGLVDPTERLDPPVPAAGETPRRLEQHFVYNALNTIAALIRTDPGRARELLFGFADLSRAADQPGDARARLGGELDAVRGYLALEQARF